MVTRTGHKTSSTHRQTDLLQEKSFTLELGLVHVSQLLETDAFGQFESSGSTNQLIVIVSIILFCHFCSSVCRKGLDDFPKSFFSGTPKNFADQSSQSLCIVDVGRVFGIGIMNGTTSSSTRTGLNSPTTPDFNLGARWSPLGQKVEVSLMLCK